MTQVTRTTFKNTTSTLYADNTTGDISAADLRVQMDNIADSVGFKVTGKTTAPTANDDTAGTGGNGVFAVGDQWLDETNNKAYICIDASTSAAVWIDLNPVVSASTITVQDEGSNTVAAATTVNFVGPNVTVTDVGGIATVTVTDADTNTTALAVQEEGSTIATADTINFVGANVTVTDVAGVATVTITDTDTNTTELAVQEEGSTVVTSSTINFVGPNATVTDVGGTSTVTVNHDETVYELVGTAIDPANGTMQFKTLSGDVTFTDSLSAGQSVLLRLVNGASHVVTWPTVTWIGAAAPTLTAEDVFVFWKEGATLYASYTGTLV